VDAVLQALSDESRRTMLESLRAGPATAGELAALLPIARPGVSRHLRVLREAGLVEVRQEAQRRVYSLRPEPLVEVDEWLGRYRALWEQRLDALHAEVGRGKRTKEHQMTSGTPAGTRIVGSLRSADGKGAVRMEDRYDTDIDDLWSALTDPRRLAHWIAEVEGDLRLGGEFHARFTSSWEGAGRVDVCEPPRRLLLTMRPGQPDETVIEARLAAVGDQTSLVIEERGLPPGELAAHGAGWQAHVEDLAAHLAGGEPADWRSRWTELTPAYQALAANLS
jgi:DNA-binding transcriptional ArsR family regulator/uncharacterized protein YndB with AHSA1/START domain